MEEAEFGAFVVAQIEEYAAQKERAGVWDASDALDRARAELSWLLHETRAGHEFLVVEDAAGGRRVADVWVGPPPAPDLEGAWLYQLTVAPEQRGRGWGRAALDALHERLARAAVPRVRLNVFRWNERALRLYRTAGYSQDEADEVGVRMSRELRGRA